LALTIADIALYSPMWPSISDFAIEQPPAIDDFQPCVYCTNPNEIFIRNRLNDQHFQHRFKSLLILIFKNGNFAAIK
jgi:hypothetical protein